MRSERGNGFLIAALLVAIVVAYSLYFIFLVVPNESHMGAVQRIFYYHVASAFVCYGAFAIVLVAGLSYLAGRGDRSALFMESAGEVGFVFCTICLGSGMIWGQVAWNTPFQLEPRLVATLILWMIFLSFNIMRLFGDPVKVRTHLAVLGIIGALTVPLVVYSIELLPQFSRLHPKVIEKGGLKDPLFGWGLLLSTIALFGLGGLLIWVRYRIGALRLLVLEIIREE